uniref:Uncharacterized protein n=1 Tax=Vespula pensylvanica TaxID=30213 RepID=A0A834NYY6_VESPE|nr:hypothetical protein H0235_009482 [Vespula pensylvanica]
MELIEAARSGAAGAAAWGKMDFHCREPRASDPITFTTRDSHLTHIFVSQQWQLNNGGLISKTPEYPLIQLVKDCPGICKAVHVNASR